MPIALLAFAYGLVCDSSAHTESQGKIKAAFLLNFARYVEWPEQALEGAETPIRNCMASAAKRGA